MIRINLLGVAKPKKRGGMPMPVAIQAPNIMAVVVVVAAITAGGNYAWYWMLQRQAESIQNQMRVEMDRNRRLADIRSKYLELERQKKQYEHRVDVINELAKQKKGPSELLAAIADTVNKTDAVWLNSMLDNGDSINLQGTALSVNAVANLMQNLRSTGRFRDVEIKETYQDDVAKDVQSFVFTLVCEKQTAQQQQQRS